MTVSKPWPANEDVPFDAEDVAAAAAFDQEVVDARRASRPPRLPEDPGSAGVREPRRPAPGPPSLQAELEDGD